MKRLIVPIVLLFLLSSCAVFQSKKEEPSPEVDESAREKEMLEIAENYVSDGVAYHESGNDSLAVVSWKKALEIIPDDAEVHNFLGIAYHQLNKIELARDEFSRAIQLNPDYYQAWNNRGFMYFLLGEYNFAKKSFEHALNINKDYKPAQLNLKMTEQILSGELDSRVFELSRMADKIDDVDKQVEIYKEILQLNPAYAEGHNNIAVAYFYMGEIDSAYNHLSTAITLRRNYPEALNNLGYIYKLAGRYRDAIKLFLKALNLKNDYIVALENLGEAYQLAGETDNSRRVFKKVLEIDPANEVAKKGLAKLDGGGK